MSTPSHTDTDVVPHVATSATAINAEHRLARACAETAVQHARRCGQLLLEQKERLERGEFSRWVQTLDFSYRTARAYMQVARQSGSALPLSLRSLLASPTAAKAESKKPRGQAGGRRTPEQRADRERLRRGPRSHEQIADTFEELLDRGITPEEWLDQLPGCTASRARSQLERVRPWLQGLCDRLEVQEQPTPLPSPPPAMPGLHGDDPSDSEPPTAKESGTFLKRALRDQRSRALLAKILLIAELDDLVDESLLMAVQLQRLKFRQLPPNIAPPPQLVKP